jgi:hypothetical protein
MPRRRPRADAELPGGADSDDDRPFLTAWGLEPAQWRPVGRMALVRQRAALLWRTGSGREDLALRVRRAYDRLGELGVTVAADSTPRGVQITLPLNRVSVALRILADRSILPDAVLLSDPPADQLRTLRREVGAFRRTVELIIGDDADHDPVATLRALLRAR